MAPGTSGLGLWRRVLAVCRGPLAGVLPRAQMPAPAGLLQKPRPRHWSHGSGGPPLHLRAPVGLPVRCWRLATALRVGWRARALGLACGPPNSWGGGPQPSCARGSQAPGPGDAIPGPAAASTLLSPRGCTLRSCAPVHATCAPPASCGAMRTPFSQAPRLLPSRCAVPAFTGADLSYWQGWLLKCQKADPRALPHPRTEDRRLREGPGRRCASSPSWVTYCTGVDIHSAAVISTLTLVAFSGQKQDYCSDVKRMTRAPPRGHTPFHGQLLPSGDSQRMPRCWCCGQIRRCRPWQ